MIILLKDCLTSKEERELEQLQQMLNLEDEQTSLKSLIMSTLDNLSRLQILRKSLWLGYLKLWKVGMTHHCISTS